METGPTDGTPSQAGAMVFGVALLLLGLQAAWQWATYDVLVIGSPSRGYVTGPLAGVVMAFCLVGGTVLVSRALAHLDRTPRWLWLRGGNARLAGALIAAVTLVIWATAK